jgi:curli biogenesis system outer membrane secretion channel CsgG
MRVRKFRHAALALAAGAVLAVTPLADAPAQVQTQRILTQQVPPVPGPKRTIAVGTIDALGAYAGAASSWNVGGSIAAMFVTALRESDRVTVVERAALSQIVTEQELATSGVSAGTAAPTPGRVVPAQFLLVGAVSEFNPGEGGTGVSAGGIGGIGLGLALNRNTGSVALDMRLVNTRTGEIAHTFSVKRQVSTTNVGVTGTYQGISLGGNQFWSTPLGEATRLAVTDAVIEIARGLSRQPWQGQVVEYDGRALIVNAGAEAGVRVGDRMRIERMGRVLTDPATGQVLSAQNYSIGMVTITEVQPRFATGTFQGTQPQPPVRGDFVILTP